MIIDNLDTSVISHLMQGDVPEKMADTLQLWDLFREGLSVSPFLSEKMTNTKVFFSVSEEIQPFTFYPIYGTL